jgi:hypothetical protein
VIAENLREGSVILSPSGDLNNVRVQLGREVTANEI